MESELLIKALDDLNALYDYYSKEKDIEHREWLSGFIEALDHRLDMIGGK